MKLEVIAVLKTLLDYFDSALWSEYGAGAAHDVIDNNRQEVLRWLLDEWGNFNSNMQEHLAYILCDGPGSIEHESSRRCPTLQMRELLGERTRPWIFIAKLRHSQAVVQKFRNS